ncbi:MAG: hypothetical protein V7739_01200 [Motiliproteus sp.]
MRTWTIFFYILICSITITTSHEVEAGWRDSVSNFKSSAGKKFKRAKDSTARNYKKAKNKASKSYQKTKESARRAKEKARRAKDIASNKARKAREEAIRIRKIATQKARRAKEQARIAQDKTGKIYQTTNRNIREGYKNTKGYINERKIGEKIASGFDKGKSGVSNLSTKSKALLSSAKARASDGRQVLVGYYDKGAPLVSGINDRSKHVAKLVGSKVKSAGRYTKSKWDNTYDIRSAVGGRFTSGLKSGKSISKKWASKKIIEGKRVVWDPISNQNVSFRNNVEKTTAYLKSGSAKMYEATISLSQGFESKKIKFIKIKDNLKLQ